MYSEDHRDQYTGPDRIYERTHEYSQRDRRQGVQKDVDDMEPDRVRAEEVVLKCQPQRGERAVVGKAAFCENCVQVFPAQALNVRVINHDEPIEANHEKFVADRRSENQTGNGRNSDQSRNPHPAGMLPRVETRRVFRPDRNQCTRGIAAIQERSSFPFLE